MKWTLTKEKNRLNVFGTDCDKDIRAVKKLITEKKVPSDLNAIVYQKERSSTVAMIIRGRYLENLLRVEEGPVVPLPPRPGIKAILKQINEANTRQTAYAGLLLYCTDTRRFLFFTDRNRGKMIQLLGDNPLDGEAPPETVCRVVKEDCDFEITPKCLVPLSPLEISGTTYYSYLCLTKNEFSPKVSESIVNCIWKEPDKIGELTLHPSVSGLFEKDKKLRKLMKPADALNELNFDKMIDDILHSS